MTAEERARELIRGHFEWYSQNCMMEWAEIVENAIAAAIEEEREACAKVADDYVIKADELKRKIEQLREAPEEYPTAEEELQAAKDAPIVDAKIAIARLTSQKLAEAIRSRSNL